jgi:hypothetical protein
MRLYRAVSQQELRDIQLQDRFCAVATSMEGKWFAERLEHAQEWGRRFYQPGELFFIICVDMPDQLAQQMYSIVSLDDIGPARWADLDLLGLINQKISGIMVVK